MNLMNQPLSSSRPSLRDPFLLSREKSVPQRLRVQSTLCSTNATHGVRVRTTSLSSRIVPLFQHGREWKSTCSDGNDGHHRFVIAAVVSSIPTPAVTTSSSFTTSDSFTPAQYSRSAMSRRLDQSIGYGRQQTPATMLRRIQTRSFRRN